MNSGDHGMRNTGLGPAVPGRCRPGSVAQFVSEQPCRASIHASGKEALRVGLSQLDLSGADEVLLPSVLPDGVVDAVAAAGAVPRFYPVEPTLEIAPERVETAISEWTAAVLGIQYFGFPQPRMTDLAAVADAHDVAFIDDSSHGALSVIDGQALGTGGDFGFASFHKPMAVPDGAVRYVDSASPYFDTSRREQCGQNAAPDSPRTADTPSGGPTREDLVYVATLAATRASRRLPGFRTATSGDGRIPGLRTATGLLDSVAGTDTDDRDPSTRDWQGQASWATRRALRRTDVAAVRSRRRAVYRAWVTELQRFPDVEPLFEKLPPGVCPWKVPVRSHGDAAQFCSRIQARTSGAFTWPPLPEQVAGAAAFPVANRLANSLVCLPTHRDITPERVRRICLHLEP